MEAFRTGVQYLAYASLLLVALQLYLTTNKLWKRKHERAVAESISIMGEFVGLVPILVLTTKFVLDGQVEGMIDGLLWLAAACVAVAIGTGRWVEGRRKRGFWRLLVDALRLERGEVGYLAKAMFRPSGADRILEILGRIALLDAHLDEREKAYVEAFAENWGLRIDWSRLTEGRREGVLDYLQLKADVAAYLATSPPPQQVEQLADVLVSLVGIDEKVTPEEEVMMAEIGGMLSAYRKGVGEAPVFAVAIVPQDAQQDSAIAAVLQGVTKTELHGGQVYVAGRYHSYDFAEAVGAQYRSLNFLTVVVRMMEGQAREPATFAPVT